ncbi:MAG: allantoinase AllB [Nocardioidaceae bacterium]
MTDGYDLVVRAPRVITADGEVAWAIGIRDGIITAIDPLEQAATPGATRVVRLGDDEVLMPGLVDTHVHINEPGRTAWEGFRSATRAAGAGGVTTVVDMPLNSIPPTCTVDALELKRTSADGQCFVDVGFFGGAVPENANDLRGLHDAGVLGFKCFLLPSGVEEFGHLGPDELEAAMRVVESLGTTMLVHAEDAAAVEDVPGADGRAYSTFLASRPRAAENLAIARVIEVARRTGCRVHIVHLASAEALPMIAAARRDGVALTVETCPHYLTFAAEEIADGATAFKCCPPIREADNREALWRGLADGTIDLVVSDHSPCTPDLKRTCSGDFGLAWGGISSVQLGLPAIWTAARQRGHTLAEVARWMAERPAAFAGLSSKGKIAVGRDADFCVFAPDDGFTVDTGELFHKNPLTPYDGRPFTGRVRATWLRGNDITTDIEDDVEPQGRLLANGGT